MWFFTFKLELCSAYWKRNNKKINRKTILQKHKRHCYSITLAKWLQPMHIESAMKETSNTFPNTSPWQAALWITLFPLFGSTILKGSFQPEYCFCYNVYNRIIQYSHTIRNPHAATPQSPVHANAHYRSNPRHYS